MKKPATWTARTFGTAAIGALVLSTATPSAWAYWSGGGSGAGTTKANALGTPTVTASAVIGIPFFRVAAAPAGLTPTSYVVTQGSNDVCTIHGATGFCSSGLSHFYLGNVAFTIVAAVNGGWTSLTPTTCTFTLPGSVASLLFGRASCAPATGPAPATARTQLAPPADPVATPTAEPTASPTATTTPDPTPTTTPDPTATTTPTPTPTTTAEPTATTPTPTPTTTAEPTPTTTPDPTPTR